MMLETVSSLRAVVLAVAAMVIISVAVAAMILISNESTPAQAAARAEEFLIVEGAQNVQWGSKHGVRFVTYTADVVYPAFAVGEPQWEQLRAAGWTKCHSTNRWQRESDLGWVNSGYSNRRYYQWHTDYWLKGNQMIAISLEHESADQKNGGEPAPDNTTQHVTIGFVTERISEWIETLRVECSE